MNLSNLFHPAFAQRTGSRLISSALMRACAVATVVITMAVFSGPPAGAFDLFVGHEVTAHFATPDGKPMANAEVRVFAPGNLKKPVETGRTDAKGKFVFPADRDGFWTVEASSKGEVARVMIRVGGESSAPTGRAPFIVIGALAVLVLIAAWYRFKRQRRNPKV